MLDSLKSFIPNTEKTHRIDCSFDLCDPQFFEKQILYKQFCPLISPILGRFKKNFKNTLFSTFASIMHVFWLKRVLPPFK